MADDPLRYNTLDDWAYLLVMTGVAGLFVFLIGLRNVGLWLLGLTGTRADATVDRVEISTGRGGEVLRRPVVTFTTATGERVTSRPAVYRKRCRLAAGEPARVSYRAGNPNKIIIHGYDFRLREPVSSVAGILLSVVSVYLYVRFGQAGHQS